MQTQHRQAGTAPRCLVVEDSEFDQKMIHRAMSSAGVNAKILYANTLQEARDALETFNFSLIIMDNKLPDGSGSDFAQELALDPAYRGVAIAISSGWPSPFMWDKARAIGLHVIDKNDDPLPKLRDLFKARLGRNRNLGTRQLVGNLEKQQGTSNSDQDATLP